MNKEQFLEIMEQQLVRLPKADRDDILSDYEAHFALGAENGQTEEEVCEQLGDPAELSATYLENLPANAKGAPYIAPAEEAAEEAAEETAQPAAEPAAHTSSEGDNGDQAFTLPDYGSPVQETYATPVYGEAQPAQAAAGANRAGTVSSDKSGLIALVVILSVFVALPIASTLIGIWFGGIGTTIGLAASGIAALVAGFAAAMANVLLGIGLCLLGVALFLLGGLLVTGLVAAAKGIIWLIKWYVDKCKNLINGGTL